MYRKLLFSAALAALAFTGTAAADPAKPGGITKMSPTASTMAAGTFSNFGNDKMAVPRSRLALCDTPQIVVRMYDDGYNGFTYTVLRSDGTIKPAKKLLEAKSDTDPSVPLYAAKKIGVLPKLVVDADPISIPHYTPKVAKNGSSDTVLGTGAQYGNMVASRRHVVVFSDERRDAIAT